jgi:hypothetical protein
MLQAASTWINTAFRVLEQAALTILIVAVIITYPRSLCKTGRTNGYTANTTQQLDLDNFL